MAVRMLRRGFFLATAFGSVALLHAGKALAAAKTYKYRCLKCKLIQEYGSMGIKKCPNDGSTMVRMN